MNINQHNYEEYFLLYADGELSAQDKLAVEQFVQENPYLAEELEMFLQLKLPVEDIVFEGKTSLFKQAEAIGIKNYEEYFLLYVDNELDAAGKQSVETFVLQHPALQEQFMQLKQTKLEPETILFPDKALLYRKEEKERRVFYMRWQRVAVAAAFIGLAVLGWKWFPASTETVNAPITAQISSTTGNAQKDHATSGNSAASENGGAHLATEAPLKTSNIITAQLDNREPSTPATASPVFVETVVTESPVKRTTIEPANTVRTENTAETVHLNEPKLVDKRFVPVATAEEDPAPARQAIYRELNTDSDDEKKSLYVGSLEINKDKLRGFFRKATSLFRGKAKQQQEEEERTETTPSTNTRSLK